MCTLTTFFTRVLTSLVAFALIACTGGDTGVLDGGTDVAPPTRYIPPPEVAPEASPGGGQTHVYVITAMQIDFDISLELPKFGFDLDGYATLGASAGEGAEGCFRTDHFSALEPDQNRPTKCLQTMPGCLPAVDNRLPEIREILQTIDQVDIATELSQALGAHHFALLLRIADVESFHDDPYVVVSIYEAHPTFATDCEASPFPPGREYTVLRSSLLDGATDITAARFRVPARILDGRLRLRADDTQRLRLPLVTRGGLGWYPLRGIHLRFDLSPQGGSAGNLGGWSSASELLDVYFGVQPDADRPLTAATLGGLVDLRIDPVSGELNGDPSIGVCDLRPPDASVRTFGGLGIGLGLSAIPARISTTTPIADAPAPGTCGTRPAASDAGVTDP